MGTASPLATSSALGPDAAPDLSVETLPVDKPEALRKIETDSLIARWPAPSFDESLRDSKVLVSHPSGNGDMLLVLDRELTTPSEELLVAMLKAIGIDRHSQPTAILSWSANGGESMNDVCVRVKPAIVLVMAMLTDSRVLAELDTHRQQLFRFPWLSAPVVVTLHPQALLENPDGKRPAWEDLKKVKAILDGQ